MKPGAYEAYARFELDGPATEVLAAWGERHPADEKQAWLRRVALCDHERVELYDEGLANDIVVRELQALFDAFASRALRGAAFVAVRDPGVPFYTTTVWRPGHTPARATKRGPKPVAEVPEGAIGRVRHARIRARQERAEAAIGEEERFEMRVGELAASGAPVLLVGGSREQRDAAAAALHAASRRPGPLAPRLMGAPDGATVYHAELMKLTGEEQRGLAELAFDGRDLWLIGATEGDPMRDAMEGRLVPELWFRLQTGVWRL